MNYLVDTHILIWLSMRSFRLDEATKALLADPGNDVYFSAISIFEIAIKQQLGKADFDIDAGIVRRAMLETAYIELPVNGHHAAFIRTLPLLHRDPFDRLLVAQANVENLTLITADEQVARYPGQIHKI